MGIRPTLKLPCLDLCAKDTTLWLQDRSKGAMDVSRVEQKPQDHNTSTAIGAASNERKGNVTTWSVSKSASASALALGQSGCPSLAGTAAPTRSLPERSRDMPSAGAGIAMQY